MARGDITAIHCLEGRVYHVAGNGDYKIVDTQHPAVPGPCFVLEPRHQGRGMIAVPLSTVKFVSLQS
jgi:hypothetical protein